MVGPASSRSNSRKKYGGKNKKSYGRKKKHTPGGYTKMYAAAGAGVIAIVGIFGWMTFRPMEGDTQDAACAILIDRTGSSISEATRASYLELARETIEGCSRFRASFSVYYFDNQNAKLQTVGSEPLRLWRPKTHRESTGDEQVAQAQRGALAAVGSVFTTASKDSSGGHGSDIVTALSLASQNLQQQAAVEGVANTYLVVLTDGFQTGELRVARNSDIQSLLNRTEQIGLIPHLKGVDVSFVGVGGGVASNRAQVSPDREALVKRYWYALVEAGGGNVCFYNVETKYLPASC